MEISDRSDLSEELVLIARDSPHSLNNTTVTHEEAEGEHQDHPYCILTPDRKQEASGDQTSSCTDTLDLTFKSFICPGEVEIADDSIVYNEAIIAKDSDLENPSQGCGDEVSEEHTELPSHHSDHQYCYTQTPEPRAGEQEEAEGDIGSVNHLSLSTNAADVTFKSFTCHGGEVEIAEESDVQSESLMKNESLLTNDSEVQNLDSMSCDEHTELPSRHLDHLYCNNETSELGSEKMAKGDACDEGDGEGCGSVMHTSISISKTTSDVTFKSFSCPGGEVEITDESLLQCESLIINESPFQDESLITKDSEVQNPQSETGDEHADIHSRHFDHPYCNGATESLPVPIDDSVVLDANNAEEVNSVNDCNVPNCSTAAEKQDDMFRLSGAKVVIENTNRIFNTSTLMKSLSTYDQVESSPRSESSEHGGDSVIGSEKDQHIYCHVIKNDPEKSVSENEAYLCVQVSNHEVLESSESAGRNEGTENMKSVIIFSESSSVTTEVQNVESVQQQDLDQQTSANPEENVLKDENARLGCDFEKELSDEKGQIPLCQPDVDEMSENFDTAETQTVQNHNTISQNANDVNIMHSDPEILRSESVNVETHMKMWSHSILSEPSTPKHSHFWPAESPIPPPQLHSTVLTANPNSPKPTHTSDCNQQKENLMKDFSAVGKGPLEDQLRKMGELLIAASGKISAPAAVTPVQQHSVCVWTTPTPQQDCSTNTSVIMEERKEVEVSDACTSTDSLLWR